MVEMLKSERTPILPKNIRRSIENLSKEIVDVRDVIEHMDERVQQDKIADDQPVMLAIPEQLDTVTIGEESLSLIRLSQTLRKLHQVGIILLELSPKKWP